MYGYSSYGSDLFSLLGFAGGIWLSLTFIAFVAAIVCTELFALFCCTGNMFPHLIKIS